MTPRIAATFLALLLAFASVPAHADWWWPFGPKKDAAAETDSSPAQSSDTKEPAPAVTETKTPEPKPEVKTETVPAAPETKPAEPTRPASPFDKEAIAKKQMEDAAKAKAEQDAFAKIEKEKADKAKAEADKRAEEQKKKDAITLEGHLQGKGSFKILLDLFAASGFSTLKNPGNYTIFAPTDEAFSKFTTFKVDDLKKHENIDTLRAILGYHLLNGNFLLKNVKGKAAPNAMQGDILPIDVGETAKAANARIVSSDDGASNGTIYIIDEVLVPPSLLKQLHSQQKK